MLKKGDLVQWCHPGSGGGQWDPVPLTTFLITPAGTLEEQVFGIILENQKKDSKGILVHWLGVGAQHRVLVKWVRLVSRGNQG